ncbi:MAG: hypothetical protein MJE68_27395 [Proteobacteria bacterium]|nr:hypothetical protein [Pseudomonadota bacterium]
MPVRRKMGVLGAQKLACFSWSNFLRPCWLCHASQAQVFFIDDKGAEQLRGYRLVFCGSDTAGLQASSPML